MLLLYSSSSPHKDEGIVITQLVINKVIDKIISNVLYERQ
jgi:hypothetical protein